MAQQSEPSRKATPAATAESVIAYLRAHPNFLNEHPEIMDALTPPKRNAGDGVIDMQHFMLERLRGEVGRLRSYHSELISTSRTNQSVQTRVHAAVVAIIAANSFERLIQLVTRELAGLLDVDVVTLCIETSGGPTPTTPGVQLLVPGSIDQLLGIGQTARLRSSVVGDPAIFGSFAPLVHSEALVRIKPSAGAPDGVIAFGSRDPNGFTEEHSTELLFFLAQVLEHTIRAWLDLPG
jgi:uncharacterized protein YigA (DUF484 family)